MINKLLSRPGVVSLFIHQPEDNMWCVVADTAHGESIWGVPGDTPQEALEGLARVMGITPDSAAHDFPTTRNTSAGELRRMHEEAEEENT